MNVNTVSGASTPAIENSNFLTGNSCVASLASPELLVNSAFACVVLLRKLVSMNIH